jgi:hypothetical protein
VAVNAPNTAAASTDACEAAFDLAERTVAANIVALEAQLATTRAQLDTFRAMRSVAAQSNAAPARKPLVSQDELAVLLAVSKATVNRLDHQGQPHLRIGDTKKYDVDAVLAWHRNRAFVAPEAAAETPAKQDGPIRLLTRGKRGGAR